MGKSAVLSSQILLKVIKEKKSLINWPRVRNITGRVLLYVIIIAGAILEVIPLLWMLVSSLKPNHELFMIPPTWIPSRLAWESYYEGFIYLPFGQYFLNTGLIVLISVLGQMIAASVVAFSFARLRWPGRDIIFVLFLASMMVPQAVTIIPEYIIFRFFKMVNTFHPLIIPCWLGSPYFIFLLRQFFFTIPKDYDDAARIDGCSNYGIYYRIILPLSGPALGVVAIYQFRFAWNDFFRPLIYLHSTDRFTLALGLRMFHNVEGGGADARWNQMMAVSFLVTLPVLIIFFFLQRFFIQGIVIAGVKG